MTAKAALVKKGVNGLSRTREYRAWKGMIDRCYDKKYKLYHRYGGRGIKVCERWLNSLDNFILDMGLCPSGKNSIDRFPNNDGDYEPGNCRWADSVEQSNNRSTNILFSIDGETKNLKQWCALYNVDYKKVWVRVNRNVPILEAILTPFITDGKFKKGHSGRCKREVINIETNTTYNTIKSAAKAAGLSYTYFADMLRGYSKNTTKFILK